MNLTKDSKFTRVSNAVAAGTSTINSGIIDMLGYESVTFQVCFGAIVASAVTSVKAQQDTAAAMGGAADLLGTSITVADDDDNGVILLEVHAPRERYVRCVVSRATQNSTVDSIVAIQTGPKEAPVTQDATSVAGHEFHLAPAQGTA